MILVDMQYDPIQQFQRSEIVASVKESSKVKKTLWTGGYVLLDSMEKSIKWNPATEACDELRSMGWFREERFKLQIPNCKVIRVEKLPKHGKIEQLPDGSFKYIPNDGYLGRDEMQLIVDAEGKKIRIMWSTSVLGNEPKNENS
ncbi:Ig-like domain-containing protein [Undibacterium sp. Di26W]|uniref:Ig-like domain-containing protein n=1 Tax=Undibacterium sp. Di26W TaxID=3413035 RepID=UPI003BF327C8